MPTTVITGRDVTFTLDTASYDAQATAESEIFKLTGEQEARKQRQKVTGLEKATFGGRTVRRVVVQEVAQAPEGQLASGLLGIQ